MASLEPAFSIAGDKRDRICLGLRHALHDEVRKPAREIASTLLLPLGYECPRAVVIDERGTRVCEGESPPHAFGAPFDRPMSRCTTSNTACRPDTNELRPTPLAKHRPRQSTRAAARREEDRKGRHLPNATAQPVTAVCRLCV
jgi:hypothetical protein